MQKALVRHSIVMAVFTIALGIVLALYIRGAGSLPGADKTPAAGLTDGVYTASAHGIASDIAVTVTVKGGAVSAVEADVSGETPDFGGKAGPELCNAILAAGKADGVDGVSGSTITSDAILSAAADCLAQAKG